MAKLVERYMASDGSIHETEQQADLRDKDLLCCKLENFVNEYFSTGHVPSTYQAVTKMEGNRKQLKQDLLSILSIIG